MTVRRLSISKECALVNCKRETELSLEKNLFTLYCTLLRYTCLADRLTRCTYMSRFFHISEKPARYHSNTVGRFDTFFALLELTPLHLAQCMTTTIKLLIEIFLIGC